MPQAKTPKVYAGDLRHRLQFQLANETRDSFGAAVKVWQTDQTRWGKVEPVKGTETTIAAQTTARVTHLITIRDYVTLTPAHRIKWGSRVFGIVWTVNTAERRIENVIQAKEVV